MVINTNIKIQRRKYEGNNTDQGSSQYDGQGEYRDLNTALEVFLIFTT